MAATRTQVYLTAQQREQLDRIANEEAATLASVIREAIDAFLGERGRANVQEVLDQTFGSMPDLEVPSRDEWDRSRG